jgi:hypothetical protein
LSDLAGAVKHIADQYVVDHLTHSLSAAGHVDNGVFSDCSLVFSNSAPSGDEENPEPSASSFDLFAGSPPAYTTDDNNKWLSEQVSGNFSFPNIPSSMTYALRDLSDRL